MNQTWQHSDLICLAGPWLPVVALAFNALLDVFHESALKAFMPQHAPVLALNVVMHGM